MSKKRQALVCGAGSFIGSDLARRLKQEGFWVRGVDLKYPEFSERMYLAYQRNQGLEVHIARFHNIFGPEGTWRGGREKAPGAFCRKVAETQIDSL